MVYIENFQFVFCLNVFHLKAPTHSQTHASRTHVGMTFRKHICKNRQRTLFPMRFCFLFLFTFGDMPHGATVQAMKCSLGCCARITTSKWTSNRKTCIHYSHKCGEEKVVKLFHHIAITITLFVLQYTGRCTAWNKWFIFIHCLHSQFRTQWGKKMSEVCLQKPTKKLTLNKSAGGQIPPPLPPPSSSSPPPTYLLWYIYSLMTFRFFSLTHSNFHFHSHSQFHCWGFAGLAFSKITFIIVADITLIPIHFAWCIKMNIPIELILASICNGGSSFVGRTFLYACVWNQLYEVQKVCVAWMQFCVHTTAQQQRQY